MTWLDALAALDTAGHLHAAHFRRLCGESNPDRRQRDAVRAHVIRLATDPPPPRVDYGEPARPCDGC